MNIKENWDKYLSRQIQLQKMIEEAKKLMSELERLEEISIKKVYDDQSKFERLINYSEEFNSIDYIFFDEVLILFKSQKKLVDSIQEFLSCLQNFTFQLNIFTNTFIENLINFEMAEKLLSKQDLNLTANQVSQKLWNINIESKISFIREKLIDLTWLKNPIGSVTSIMNSGIPLKFSNYYFENTKWKLKILSDYKKYLLFKQLYFRYSVYKNENINEHINLDIVHMHMSQEVIIGKNISVLLEFVSMFEVVLNMYPITHDNSRKILRSIFSVFGIYYIWAWKVEIELIKNLRHILKENNNDNENDEIYWFIKELEFLISQCTDILYRNKYSTDIEKFKNKYNLDDLDFEHFKDFRFSVMFLEWNIILHKYSSLVKCWLVKKLENSEYFNILKCYWNEVQSLYGTYGSFNKKNIKKLKKDISSVSEELPKNYLDDLEYLASWVNNLLITL